MAYPSRLTVYKLIFSLLLFTTPLLLTGCIDLAAVPNNPKFAPKTSHTQGHVYVMRGGLGGIFSTGMNQLQKTLQTKYHMMAESTVWYKANDLSTQIIKQYQSGKLTGPIILAGHSLGANEQIKVAANLARANIPVALLITIDAVSPLKIPPNVQYVLNIYKPSLVPMFSGHKIQAEDPEFTHIDNLKVKDLAEVKVNHFTIDKNSKIQQLMLQKILLATGYKPVKRHR